MLLDVLEVEFPGISEMLSWMYLMGMRSMGQVMRGVEAGTGFASLPTPATSNAAVAAVSTASHDSPSVLSTLVYVTSRDRDVNEGMGNEN